MFWIWENPVCDGRELFLIACVRFCTFYVMLLKKDCALLTKIVRSARNHTNLVGQKDGIVVENDMDFRKNFTDKFI